MISHETSVRRQLGAAHASSWFVRGLLGAAALVVVFASVAIALRADEAKSRSVARALHADSSVLRLRGRLAVPLAGDTLSQRMLLFKNAEQVDSTAFVSPRGIVVYVASLTCPMCQLLDRHLDSSHARLPLIKIVAGERSRIHERDGVVRLGPPPSPFLPAVYAVPTVFVLDSAGVIVSVANGDVSRSAFLLGRNASLDFDRVRAEISKLRDSTISARKTVVAH